MNSALASGQRPTASQSRQYENEKIIDGWGSLETPYSQEAEEATLGAIIVNSAVYQVIAPFLKADDFFILRHRYIWEAIARLDAREEPIDYLTVQQELKDTGRLSEIGGPAYLTHLVNTTPTSVHGEVYARLVEFTSGRRKIMAVADEMKAMALNGKMTYKDVYLASQTKLDAVAPSEKTNVVPGRDSIQAFNDMQFETVQRIESGEMVVYPLPKEMGDLTRLVPHVAPGDFIVISGGSGSGKSCALEQLGEGFANLGIPTDYNHTEMSKEDVLNRRMARHSGLPYDMIVSAGYTPTQKGYTVEQRAKMDHAETEIATFADKLTYTWMPDVKWDELMMRLRRRAGAGVKVFLIDHFQDITIAPNGREDNVVRMYEKACIWLAAFAEKRKVVIIVASQENDKGEVKWSKKLKEKAVTWISFKRDKLYNEFSYYVDGVEIRSFPGEEHPIAKAVVGKARFGKKGSVKLLNNGPRFRWLDPSMVQYKRDFPVFNGKEMASGEEIPQ
jgi:replicative DNA helicase